MATDEPGIDVKARVLAKKAELDRLRPGVGKSLAALTEWYDVELTYTSNAIEGNSLTRIETAVVLEHGIEGLTISGKPLKDHLEAIGHQQALGFVRALAEKGEPIHEIDIRAIHRLVMERVDPQEAGAYSGHERMIKGSPLVLPSPWHLGALMSDFGQWLSSVPASPDSAFEAHARLVTIHPFSDGNGRTARLLMNLLLWKASYPPVVIAPEHRLAYLDSLQKLQLEADSQPYGQFMFNRLEASLDDYLKRLNPGHPPIHSPRRSSNL